MWRVSTAPVAASASIGVNRKKFWLLIRVMCTGSRPAQLRASSSAAVTPANPPPRITIRGASDVDGLARIRLAAGAATPEGRAGMVAIVTTLSLSSTSDFRSCGGIDPFDSPDPVPGSQRSYAQAAAQPLALGQPVDDSDAMLN